MLTVLSYVGIFLAGLVAGLKVIAPRTKTKVDDKVLEYAEKAEEVYEKIVPVPAPLPVLKR